MLRFDLCFVCNVGQIKVSKCLFLCIFLSLSQMVVSLQPGSAQRFLPSKRGRFSLCSLLGRGEGDVG